MVHSGVLVLNKSFLPVQITTVRRAFCLLYGGIAKAVNAQYETFDFDSWQQLRVEINDDAIGLVDRMIKVPRVILLIAYDRVPNAGSAFPVTTFSPGIKIPVSIVARDFSPAI